MRIKIKTIAAGTLDYFCDRILLFDPLSYIRIANVLFILQLAYLHGSTLFVHYPSPPLTDTVWYLCDKVIILMLYCGLLCFVKDTFLKWEVAVICIFSVLRIIWQLWELSDYQGANSDVMQLGIFLFDLVVCVMLLTLRISVKRFHKED